MYIVRDQQTKAIVHVNPAPLRQDLSPVQVYSRFDPVTMEVGRSDDPLPEHYKIATTGEIVELTLQEKVDAGFIVLRPEEKVEDDKIVEKTLSEKVADGLIGLSPVEKIIGEGRGERIVRKTLIEQVEEGLVTLEPHQKIVNDQIVDKTTQELIDESLLTRDEAKDRSVKRLRGEAETYFDDHKTPTGYPLDNLSRQKASLSTQFRTFPDDDENKRRLLEAGLIYPNEILDEILAEVAKVQAAYNAAKKAIVTALEAGEPVASWESVSIRDFLPEEGSTALFAWAGP